MSELELKPFNLREFSSEVAEFFRPWTVTRAVTIRENFWGEPITINADHDKLHCVLINLVYNAIKFTPQGGQVQLDTRVRDDGFVQFCVSDAGPGIPPNELPRIFDAFYTGESVPPEQRGTGLGLTVCKGLVELHYGNIWVESELGKGSAFYVILPMRR